MTPDKVEAALAYFRNIDAVGASRRHEHLSVLTEALAERGWRPIESAPRDGWFLAFKPDRTVIVGTILDADHPDCEFDGGVHEMWSHQFVDGITHWQPLPEPPHDR